MYPALFHPITPPVRPSADEDKTIADYGSEVEGKSIASRMADADHQSRSRYVSRHAAKAALARRSHFLFLAFAFASRSTSSNLLERPALAQRIHDRPAHVSRSRHDETGIPVIRESTLEGMTVFVPQPGAEAAVDRLAEIYETSVTSLRTAIERFATSGTPPEATIRERGAFVYPELRVIYRPSGSAPRVERSFARFNQAGVHAASITRPDFFRPYLIEQLGPLMADYGAQVEVRLSTQEIPFFRTCSTAPTCRSVR